MLKDATTDFIDKWRARWPEWRVAEAFIPLSERTSVLAWFAMRQELTDAAWGGSDPLPGQTKLAWWIEELEGWACGRRRHPLGIGLSQLALPWSMLAASLPALGASRERAVDMEHAILALEPFALGVAAIIAASDDRAAPASARAASARAASARDVALGLLAERLLTYGGAAVPLRIGAAIPNETSSDACAAAGTWAAKLLEAWQVSSDGGRATRIHAALLRKRLQAYANGAVASTVLPHWQTLTTAWRAARG